MNTLLICIAFHYSEERLKYLQQVVGNIMSHYDVPLRIIIDTNSSKMIRRHLFAGTGTKQLEVHAHENLSHPFHLTWMHRWHIKRELNNFDNFMYVEDDMLVPYLSFLFYQKRFNLLWPDLIPSFVRIEKYQGEEFVTDITEQIVIKESNIIHKDGAMFYPVPYPKDYHAFWIMPREALQQTMRPDFVRLSDSREIAASYPNWELKKKSVIEIYSEDGKWFVHPSCFSYHITNNYAQDSSTQHAKIKIQDILI